MSEECDTRVGEEVGPTRLVGGGRGPVEVGLPVGRCGFGLWLCGPGRRPWSPNLVEPKVRRSGFFRCFGCVLTTGMKTA